MTSAQMLARIRYMIDESTAAFWVDANIYQSLSDGQREIVNFLIKGYEIKKEVSDIKPPEALRKLITETGSSISLGATSFTLPSDFLKEIYVSYNHAGLGSLKPCFKREYKDSYIHDKANTYLTLDGTNSYYYRINASDVVFDISASPGNAGYSIGYFKKPTEIDGSTNPILPDFTHEAIVYYAIAEQFKRDYKFNEAMQYYQKFLQMVQNF